MPFEIQYKGKVFSIESFIAEPSQGPWFLNAQLFLENWLNNRLFTFHSSGSTGKPKSFSFQKWQLELSASATIEALNLQEGSPHFLLCLDPKFVGGAMVLARALVLDCPITIMEPRSNVLNQLQINHPFTFASFVPMQLIGSEFPKVIFERISKVLVGGSSMAPNLETFLSSCSNEVFHSYGMTETLSNVAVRKLGFSKGYLAISPYGISINQESCISIDTPILSDQLVTNDIGRWIAADEFEIIGRKDFVINSGGIKVNPEQLEQEISTIPELSESSEWYIGKGKNEVTGEEPVLVFKGFFTEENIFQILELFSTNGLKKLSPKRFLRIHEFPLTESGKINRLKLNEWIESQIDMDEIKTFTKT